MILWLSSLLKLPVPISQDPVTSREDFSRYSVQQPSVHFCCGPHCPSIILGRGCSWKSSWSPQYFCCPSKEAGIWCNRRSVMLNERTHKTTDSTARLPAALHCRAVQCQLGAATVWALQGIFLCIVAPPLFSPHRSLQNEFVFFPPFQSRRGACATDRRSHAVA